MKLTRTMLALLWPADFSDERHQPPARRRRPAGASSENASSDLE